jgi:hypothetical protein
MAMLSGVTINDVGSIFTGIGGLLKDIRAAITGKLDPAQQLEIESKILELQAQAQSAQNQINLAEAQNPNIFVSGWRPFIGWVCGSGLAYAYILMPLLQWLVTALGATLPPLPDLNTGELVPLLTALLGLGGLRTVEKVQKVARG